MEYSSEDDRVVLFPDEDGGFRMNGSHHTACNITCFELTENGDCDDETGSDTSWVVFDRAPTSVHELLEREDLGLPLSAGALVVSGGALRQPLRGVVDGAEDLRAAVGPEGGSGAHFSSQAVRIVELFKAERSEGLGALGAR